MEKYKELWIQYASMISFLTPLKYVSGNITEYDISSANINILYSAGAIDSEYYNYMKSIMKYNREREIGLLLRSNPEYSKIIEKGITDAKYKLLSANNVDINTIVRIAKDAVYINNSLPLKNIQFGNIVFNSKNKYNSMMHLLSGKLIIFFRYDNFNNIDVDVKGLGKSAYLHNEYMLSIISNIIHLIERSSVEDAIKFLSDFIDDYLNLRLDKGFYRELNAGSYYRIKDSDFLSYDVNSIDELDINFNYMILREIWSILISIYKRR